MTTVTLDYEPILGGDPFDPLLDGGGVDLLSLFADESRTGDPVLTAGPAVRLTAEDDPHPRFRFTFTQPADGTYYAIVEWREAVGAEPYRDVDEIVVFPLPVADEPPPEGASVSVTEVARRAGFPQPVTPAVRQAIEDAIFDAQADVEAYLGRPVMPAEKTDTGLYSHGSAWLLTERPVLGITAVEPEKNPVDGSLIGTFAVTYLYGIDAANGNEHRPIRRYIAAHAAALARQSPVASTAGIKRGIKSVNVEGQGITYSDEIGSANATGQGSGAIGTLPVIESLSRWKRRGVFQRRG